MVNVLLVGPLPPPMGGDTRHFATLVGDLEANPDFEITLINTSRGGGFRNPVHNLVVAVQTAGKICWSVRGADLISFHASDRGMIRFAPLITTLARIMRRPVVFRLFGGSFGDYYFDGGWARKGIIRRFVLSAPVTLLQTKRMIEQLESAAAGRLEWFSTYISTPPDHPGRLEEARKPAESTCRRFVFLGHLWATKGIEVLLDGAPSLPDGVEVDVYGPQDEYSAADIDRRGQGRIRYCGFLSHDEVYERLWAYDCLLLPTFHPGEGYPGVIAEAFSHGLPVITTNWLAIPEIVDESNGILIDIDDTPGLVDAISKLNADNRLWHELRAGAALQGAKFDHRLWAKKFESLCHELVAG